MGSSPIDSYVTPANAPKNGAACWCRFKSYFANFHVSNRSTAQRIQVADLLTAFLPQRLIQLIHCSINIRLDAGWHLEVREWRALEIANRAVGFPVGHASANLGFYGWRSKPIWNILVFSADDPPSERGLVRVDGITGSVVEQYAEPVPEGEL